MELRHLRYFAAVAELGNVTQAATRLHVAQPALSRQIQDLEEELGVKLLERSTGGIKPTEAVSERFVRFEMSSRANNRNRLTITLARDESS